MSEATVLGGQEVVGVGRIEGPILIVEGDHYPTARPADPCPAQMKQINAAGGNMTYVHLPKIKKIGIELQRAGRPLNQTLSDRLPNGNAYG